MDDVEFTPEQFLDLMHHEIPRYEELEDETAGATEAVEAARILELGFGTGETTRRVLARHPGAQLVGIDGSSRMLAAIRIEGAEFRRAELVDPLPEGPFDLVVSCLTIHHLDGEGKRDLFRRVAAVLADGGSLVFGDVIVPEDPADAVTPLTPDYDLPDRLEDQLAWLHEAGFVAEPTWVRGDLAVLRARRLPPSRRSRWRIRARSRRARAT
ncbi:MAG TPA: class I SAM-dependent methyltransferase [Gaiellaceae bacterium]|nr:class I SAM-dependent methyltransferase [Gaiellaceae bacterium]